jgi:hypothetical protein
MAVQTVNRDDTNIRIISIAYNGDGQTGGKRAQQLDLCPRPLFAGQMEAQQMPLVVPN